MNPNTPFSGQQPGTVRTPSNISAGTFPGHQPFRQFPLFEQNSGGLVKNPGFTHLSDFTVTSGLRGSSSGQTLGFGQPPGFTPSFSLGQETSFVTPAPTSTSFAGKQGFSFKSPMNLGTSQGASNFEATSGGTSSSGFAGSDFRFKTAEDALFKPIFDTGSEQEKVPNRLISSCPMFPFPVDSGAGQFPPFGMTRESSRSSASTNFSVSKPVSGNTLTSSFTASSPSKTVENDEKRTAGLFTSPSSSFISYSNASVGSLPLEETFPMSKTSKTEHEELLVLGEQPPLLGKGTKKKEEQDRSPRKRDYDTAEEPELLARSDHAGNKRPVKLTRPSVGGVFGGVFGRTLQDILKSSKDGGRPTKESKVGRVALESGDMEQTSVAGGSQSGFAVTRLAAQEEDPKTQLKGMHKNLTLICKMKVYCNFWGVCIAIYT